ncbi:protein ALP1-like [Anneissia japonica]|uniref:protein ALP1-like n=1 Tax=Anneissia japonica TaxID=1529436 RepID=UPI0014257997|nr:protein ALP1-like [Anneissia japonica]
MKKGFPQVAGAIDGTHIKIFAPQKDAQDYFNRKWSFSVVLQALVDADGKFMNTFVGMPGSVHDARVFNLSALSKKLQEHTLFTPNNVVEIEGSAVPLLILGDAAYPLLPNLIRPFIGRGCLNRSERMFNYKHSATRMTVEKAFGRLKGRWRILLKENEHELDNIRPIVQTCCTLHNICEISNSFYNPSWNEGVELDSSTETVCRQPPTESAKTIRESLVMHLNTRQ